MERMNRTAGGLEQKSGGNDVRDEAAERDLRTLTEMELALAGGGEDGVEWP